MRMRFGPVAVGLALALALGGCHSGPDERFAAEAARPADVVERVNAPGSVTAAAQAELTAAAAATVDQLPVRDGAKVGPGEVVARLTSSQVDESLRQAQAALASASSLGSAVPSLPTDQAVAALGEVQSQVTATSLAVITSLRSVAGTLPQPQRSRLNARLDQAERQLDQTRRRTNEAIEAAGAAVEAQTSALSRSLQAATAAQRAQAALAVEAAKSQKDRLTLRAPLGGTVQLGREQTGGGGGLPSLPSLPQGAEQALQGLTGGGGGQEGPVLRVGSEVDAGQVVATVYDVDSLDVTTEVDETDVALVRNGQRAEVELDAFPGARFEAHVRRVAVAPSSGTERSAAGGVTYQVDLALGRELEPGEDGRSALPRVGMTATAEIEVRHARNTLSVPGSALVGRGRGQSVYVIEDGRVRLRSVRVAADGDDRVAIASGLREGERVVSKGAERLRDGQTWPGS